MREIKFRAWREWDRRMVYDDICICLSFQDDGTINQCSSVAMQFTGLKDRNGVDIFEGDIVHVPYNSIGNQVVKFAKGKFDCTEFNLHRIAVVGNIYEHGHLLTDGEAK